LPCTIIKTQQYRDFFSQRSNKQETIVMERTCPTPCSRNASSRPSWLSLLATLLLLVGAPLCSYAGLSGTYTVGGSGDDYSTIASAINALDQNGVSGPVVFVISGGTYTSHPAVSGWATFPE
jgi:hypothetical protein